jgi:hypothetical protein
VEHRQRASGPLHKKPQERATLSNPAQLLSSHRAYVRDAGASRPSDHRSTVRKRVGSKMETPMKNVLRIVAVVLPLVGSATLAFAQTTRDQGVVTGSEQNTEEHLGVPAYTHPDSDAR